jgi:hypothetical protein
MNPEQGLTPERDALLALLEMGEHKGTQEGFLGESTTKIRIRLNCSGTEARRILDELRTGGEAVYEMSPGKELGDDEPMPLATWRWFIPRR